MAKSPEFFLQSSNKYFGREIFFLFGQILFNLGRMFAAHHENSFVPCVFKVSIDHPFDNLGLEI